MENSQKPKTRDLYGLAEQPNLRHGVFPFLKSGVHPCNKCLKKDACDRYEQDADCTYLAEYQDQLEDAVMGIDIISDQDRPLVQLLAKQMAVLALCEMYFAQEGMVKQSRGKVEAQPLVATYNMFMRAAKDSMQGLGLGPAARSKINMDRLNVVKMMKELGVNEQGQLPDADQPKDEGYDFLND